MSKLTLVGKFGFMSVARTQEERQFYADFYASMKAETLRGKVMNITSYTDKSLIHLLREFFPNTAHANKLLTNMIRSLFHGDVFILKSPVMLEI